MKLVLHRYGKTSEEDVKDIVTLIEECFERLKAPEILDLLLFESQSEMTDFFKREREAVGVVSEEFGEKFYARHDAWRGTPRIAVCLGRIKELPKPVRVGVLRHEVGHSVLHGSIEFYMFPIPPILSEVSTRFKLPDRYAPNLLYLISIAVKDYEVTRLLTGKGYVDDQLAYSKHFLPTSEEDLAAWRISKEKPAAIGLCLAGRLKEIACAIALRTVIEESTVIKWIEDELSYLPDPILKRMMGVARKFPAMTNDTSRNVDAATKIFVKELLEPLLEGT